VALGSSPDVRFRTKQEYVYQSLRSAIMRGELPPGQRLVIDEIARRLEVSAIPIREALQSLQAEGLVVSAPHIGATVASISQDEVREVFAIMEGLETVAVREAAARLTEVQGLSLGAIVAEMDGAVERREYESWADMNGRLHRTIGEIASMPLLREMTDRALSRWERLRRHYFQGVLVPRVEQAQREHRELLAALVSRDADVAERVVRAHNRNAQAAYSAFLHQQQPNERSLGVSIDG
jgi:DNA-binding GntR family transcriptional regulator